MLGEVCTMHCSMHLLKSYSVKLQKSCQQPKRFIAIVSSLIIIIRSCNGIAFCFDEFVQNHTIMIINVSLDVPKQAIRNEPYFSIIRSLRLTDNLTQIEKAKFSKLTKVKIDDLAY